VFPIPLFSGPPSVRPSLPRAGWVLADNETVEVEPFAFSEVQLTNSTLTLLCKIEQKSGLTSGANLFQKLRSTEQPGFTRHDHFKFRIRSIERSIKYALLVQVNGKVAFTKICGMKWDGANA
jgi:hypothetical protein